MNLLKNLTTKQRQMLTVAVIIGAAVALLVTGVLLTSKKPDTKKAAARNERKFTIMPEKVEKDMWVAAEGQNIKALEKSNEELKNQLDKMITRLDKMEKTEKMETGTRAVHKNGKDSKPNMPPVPLPVPSSVKKPLPAGTPPIKPDKDKQAPLPGSTIKVWKSESPDARKQQGKTKKDDNYVWIPSGSITKAVVISGMDVPTSINAKVEPYPTLLMLSDFSMLPNRFSMDLKECFIIGAGYGNMVEERAYIRTETLSCVKNDGTPWEVSLKGQVMGEDGKLGMRGKVISKQGKQIALSIITGVLSGLGDAFKPQSTLSYVRVEKADDTVKTLMPDMKDVALGAGMSGTGNALGRISDYYLKLAEQIYPVIEIDPGRIVDVVVIKGGKLTAQEKATGQKETKQEVAHSGKKGHAAGKAEVN